MDSIKYKKILSGEVFILRRGFLKLKLIIPLMIFIFTFIFMSEDNAGAITGSNTGLTGLWEYPNAEMPDDGNGRFGVTKATPYGFYFLDLAWLPWLEVNARFDTFNSIYTGQGRRYMDKAIDDLTHQRVIKAVLKT